MVLRDETVSCPVCSLLQRVAPIGPRMAAECRRCGATLDEWKVASPVPSAAFALAALILYVPANLYPILSMERYGVYTESTIWGGVVALAQAGYWFVAAIVFAASMVVPLLKLAGLLFLVGVPAGLWRRARTRLYRLIDAIGPWAMLDVFLVAVLIALVRLGALATVSPGPGLTAFAGVVVLTLLATALFEPRLLWRGAPRERAA